MQNSELEIQLDYILNLICTADDYGHESLIPTFAEMIGNSLSTFEIEQYAKELSESEGYDEEDYHDAIDTLNHFKQRYCAEDI